MPFAESLPAALASHSRIHPEEPWFFIRRGWDWSWAPWAEVAGQVAAWTTRLAEAPPGSRIAFADRPWPRALVLDLAAQATGRIAVPLRGEAAVLARQAAGLGCSGWIGPDDLWSPLRSWGPAQPEAGAGGALVALAAAGPAGDPPGTAARELSQEDLRAAAAGIQALLTPEPPAGRGRRQREILVSGGSLADLAERRLLAWALLARAALVLEDEPAAAVATAAWARPTLFQGTAPELARLRRAAEEAAAGWPRLQPRLRRRLPRSRPGLPFGRLHTVLVAGDQDLAPAERAFWSGRGVAVARVV